MPWPISTVCAYAGIRGLRVFLVLSKLAGPVILRKLTTCFGNDGVIRIQLFLTVSNIDTGICLFMVSRALVFQCIFQTERNSCVGECGLSSLSICEDDRRSLKIAMSVESARRTQSSPTLSDRSSSAKTGGGSICFWSRSSPRSLTIDFLILVSRATAASNARSRSSRSIEAAGELSCLGGY